MINPQSNTEKIAFSTVRIKTNQGSGTGFFFEFEFSGKKYPVLITNKHVVDNGNVKEIRLQLHLRDGDLPADESIWMQANGLKWLEHPELDLCFCFIVPIFNTFEEQGKKIFFIPLNESLIKSDSDLEELSNVENVLMFGSPIGLWDEENNLPLIRRGITASHPALDFNDKSIAAIDIAAFPGSSGSPVFVYDNGSYSDRLGNVKLGESRVIFLGILFGGPMLSQKGAVEIQEIPMKQNGFSYTQLPINIGYYIKAKEVLALKEIAQKAVEAMENK